MFDQETVKYVSTSSIEPSTHPSSQGAAAETTRVDIIDLNPWDLKMLQYPYMQRGFLFTDDTEHHQQEKPVDVINHLKNSFTETLEYFYPLSGRLAIRKHEDDDEETSISIYIDCKNSTGAEFINAIADITVSDVLDSSYADPCVVHECFLPFNGALSHEGQSLPLLSVQVTKLIDGIFIGCSMNHSVCDGTSFWHFIASWAAISRGAALNPPILERCFYDTDCPIRIPISTFQLLPQRYSHKTGPLEERIFQFQQESIAKLKTKANSEISEISITATISSLQVLFAHIWLATTRARKSNPNEETSFWLSIGNRSRMNPPLPEAYFGNSLQHGVATAKAGELLDKGHGWAALLLNQVIVSYDDEKVLNVWKSWVARPGFMFTGNAPPPKNILVSVGSPRFNVYGNDFGWGKPVTVRTGRSSHYDGRVIPNRGLVEGSIDLEVCLSREIMKAIEDDKEFMDPVTIFSPPSV
ncbi:hypothetical protein C5167_044804 [Papaver somniferum]|uniref:protein ENHANCED PSEUDOMONAS SUSCEPTIBILTY 1-like n=1 Tax=Papaver somniferum TaxID=3469 RepID=UPI000E6F683F|nr:protein ENHANCED PSEUDOMONAS SUSCEPTIBILTY 1-like [Papaver somniferum]RZC90174.1 hypothetical protein C5167_044804 [Papaver somniferum]